MIKDNATWDNLFQLFQQHIEEAVEKQVKEKLAELKEQQSQKLFSSLEEASHILGIPRRSLKDRHKHGTLKLHYYNSNTYFIDACG